VLFYFDGDPTGQRERRAGLTEFKRGVEWCYGISIGAASMETIGLLRGEGED
jgi:hypothetical protein